MSLVHFRPRALRFAPWTLGIWLVAFLLLLVQPCCDALAAAAAAHGTPAAIAANTSAWHDAGHPGHQRDNCQLQQASLHLLPTLANLGTVSTPARAINAARQIAVVFPGNAVRQIAEETGPPGDIFRTYLTTLRLRI